MIEIKSNIGVDKFISSLEMSVAAKVVKTVLLLKEFGHTLTMPHSKSIGRGLLELRIRSQQEIRIIYCFRGGVSVQLLHGFIKKSQKIPQKEIDIALARMRGLT